MINKVNEIEALYFNPEHVAIAKKNELQVLRENNIAESIFPYFEDQTMTNSEVLVLKRQENLSNPNQTTEVVINIDLSKWNLHFKDNSVRPLDKVLDQLFLSAHTKLITGS